MSDFKELRISIKKVDNGFILGFMNSKNWDQKEEIYFDHGQLFRRLEEIISELKGQLALPKPVIDQEEESHDIPF